MFRELLFVSIIGLFYECYSSCNYVYHNATDTAWATNVCIWNAAKAKYMKYECPLTSDVNKNTVYVSYFQDSLCSTQTDRYDLIENIGGAFAVAYDCSGYEGCYVNFMDNCDSSAEQYHIYSPVDTCITKSDGTSFEFQCDNDDFYYVLYNNNNCALNLDDITKSDPITSCKSTIINTDTKNWQFQACSNEPTMAPSESSLAPSAVTPGPTEYPTKQLPPFINRTIEQIINELGGKSDASSINISFTFSLIFIICGIMICF